MDDWQPIAGQLYLALNVMPCRCTKQWQKVEGIAEMTVVTRCSRCAALERYREAAGLGEVVFI